MAGRLPPRHARLLDAVSQTLWRPRAGAGTARAESSPLEPRPALALAEESRRATLLMPSNVIRVSDMPAVLLSSPYSAAAL